jgi:hypothetical protein
MLVDDAHNTLHVGAILPASEYCGDPRCSIFTGPSDLRSRPGVRARLAHSWHNGGSVVKPNRILVSR